MEGHLDNLLREAQTREETVVFSKLDSLVQMARFATKKLPPYWDTNLMNNDTVTVGKSGDNVDGDENAVLHAQEAVATVDPGERDIARVEKTTPGNPFQNGGTLYHAKLDKDEQEGLQRIMKTFESVRSDMAKAWNNAMVWIDDEVVFARLNTLMTVAKDATDRVIEAKLRAKANAANRLKKIKNVIHPQHTEEKSITQNESVQQPDMHPYY